MVRVQEWAEIRRMGLVQSLSIREIARRTGRHRDTVRAALSSPEPPRYLRPAKGSKLDPFKDEVHRLLRADARIPSQRIRELLGEQGRQTNVRRYLLSADETVKEGTLIGRLNAAMLGELASHATALLRCTCAA